MKDFRPATQCEPEIGNRPKLISLFILLLMSSSDSQNNEALTPETWQERVLILQEYGAPTINSVARLATPFPTLTKFTICYWIKLYRFREEGTLLSYALSDKNDDEMRMDHRLAGFRFGIRGVWVLTSIKTPLMYWSHFCVQYNFDNQLLSIYLNGERKVMQTLNLPIIALAGNGSLIIGQEQDSYGGSFERDQSFCGEFTKFNIWDDFLETSVIADLANCRTAVEGSSISWSQSEWNISGVAKFVQQNSSEMCSNPQRIMVFFPNRLSLKNAHMLCTVVGGNMSLPVNDQENKWLYEFSKDKAGHCSGYFGTNYLWLGANDRKDEGTWVHWNSGKPLTYQGKWRNDGPNGGRAENCLVMLSGGFAGLWSDIACLDSYMFCTACEFDHYSMMYLKGQLLCETSPFNTEYLLFQYVNERPTLTGIFHSDIYWDNSTQAWILVSLKEPSAVAKFKPDSPEQYPFGKHEWIVQSEICGFSPNSSIVMTLSACPKGFFTCNDGTCIDIIKVCDLKLDCLDDSDEYECSLIELADAYNTNLPPSASNNTSDILILNLSISIVSFPSIKTEELAFDVNLKLLVSWQDIRIDFTNLKDMRSLNLLSTEDVSRIWSPTIFFQNANGNLFSNLGPGARVECIKNGNPLPGGPQYDREVNIYKGSENALQMSQIYSATYSCDFNLLMFPFDEQKCVLIFSLISASSSYMKLKPVQIEYLGNKELIEYLIGDEFEVEEVVEGELSQLKIYVHFLRRSGFYLLTIYIPTTFLDIIAYATLYFNPVDFNSRIEVSLTSLLVLASIFSQTSNSLPKTSYFKLVDVWLFFSIVVIFIVILFHTMAEFHSFILMPKSIPENSSTVLKVRTHSVSSDDYDGKHSLIIRRLNKYLKSKQDGDGHFKSIALNIKILLLGRIVTPVIFLLFNIIYWAAALNYVEGLKSKENF